MFKEPPAYETLNGIYDDNDDDEQNEKDFLRKIGLSRKLSLCVIVTGECLKYYKNRNYSLNFNIYSYLYFDSNIDICSMGVLVKMKTNTRTT